jgi:tRNA dimethylallyltransferase
LNQLPSVVIITGPTASGKSALALTVALRFNGEVINADSMQMYAELSIFTACPSLDDEAQVPHHLYRVLSGADVCSAGRWLGMAIHKIKEVHKRGKLPIICGGTGLYLKVLREGIAPVPDIPSNVLERATVLYLESGAAAFVEILAKLDPISAAKLNPLDRQRLVRAYCVVTATGRSLPEWQRNQTKIPPLHANYFTVYLLPDRAQLYSKIECRFDDMIDGGGFDEVKALQKLNLATSVPVMKALGVPEIISHLSGKIDLDVAINSSKKTTRNLAKRQMTWLRNQGKPNLVLNDFGSDVKKACIGAISEFLVKR